MPFRSVISPHSVLLLCFLSSLLMTACIEREEGCLDVAAVNFAADADLPCPDSCCTYPSLRLELQHRIHTAERPDTLIRFFYDSTYAVLPDTTVKFTFDSIRFFLSDFEMIREDGSTASVTDRLELTDATGETISLIDDLFIAERNSFGVQTLGDFRTEGRFTGVRFLLGIEEALRTADAASLPTDHPLVDQNNEFNTTTDGYTALSLRLRQPPATDNTTALRIVTATPIELSFETIFIEPGFDVKLTLAVDYLDWFEGVLVNDATDAELRDHIRNAFSNSFEVIAVSLE